MNRVTWIIRQRDQDYMEAAPFGLLVQTFSGITGAVGHLATSPLVGGCHQTDHGLGSEVGRRSNCQGAGGGLARCSSMREWQSADGLSNWAILLPGNSKKLSDVLLIRKKGASGAGDGLITSAKLRGTGVIDAAGHTGRRKLR